LKEISRQELEWLIKNGILKMEYGKYPDLSGTSKKKKSRRKKILVPDFMANRVAKEMYKKDNE